MPCYSGGPSETDTLQWEVDKLTQLLCYTCKEIENNALLWQQMPERFIDWYKNHKEADARVLSREEMLRKRRELQASALEKLTLEEVRALHFIEKNKKW